MKRITPFLWFDGQAEEAMNFYLAVFGDGEMLEVSRYPEESPGAAGTVMTARFRLRDQEFIALNGGPQFPFTEAVSFVVDCDTQDEVDHFWDRLSEGGEPGQCGWLKDRFGVSWQIIPKALGELLGDPDPVKSQRVMTAFLAMGKLDIAGLRSAHRGE
jgi:predicted 3-demethylubiquinone-9 3-methyltransferase (glyoxalase superfamily)